VAGEQSGVSGFAHASMRASPIGGFPHTLHLGFYSEHPGRCSKLARVQWRAACTQSEERCRGGAIGSGQRTPIDVEAIPTDSSKHALVDIPTNSPRNHSF
jgi:hypothetical protein